jgi:hypothetical protein
MPNPHRNDAIVDTGTWHTLELFEALSERLSKPPKVIVGLQMP